MSGISHIPLTEVEAWLDIQGIYDPEDKVFAMIVFDAMDDAWVEAARKQIPKTSR